MDSVFHRKFWDFVQCSLYIRYGFAYFAVCMSQQRKIIQWYSCEVFPSNLFFECHILQVLIFSSFSSCSISSNELFFSFPSRYCNNTDSRWIARCGFPEAPVGRYLYIFYYLSSFEAYLWTSASKASFVIYSSSALTASVSASFQYVVAIFMLST